VSNRQAPRIAAWHNRSRDCNGHPLRSSGIDGKLEKGGLGLVEKEFTVGFFEVFAKAQAGELVAALALRRRQRRARRRGMAASWPARLFVRFIVEIADEIQTGI
jgi:hypothetical protein